MTEDFGGLAASNIDEFGLGFDVSMFSVSVTIVQVCAKLTIDNIACNLSPVAVASLREVFHCFQRS